MVAGGDPGLRHIWLSAHQMNWDMDVRQTFRMVLDYRLFTALVLQPDRRPSPRNPNCCPSPLGIHHQKAALCAPPGTPSGRTAISWPRALHPGGCPLARGILIWPVVISYAYVGFMAISFPLLACLVLVGQGSPTDREVLVPQAGIAPNRRRGRAFGLRSRCSL